MSAIDELRENIAAVERERTNPRTLGPYQLIDSVLVARSIVEVHDLLASTVDQAVEGIVRYTQAMRERLEGQT